MKHAAAPWGPAGIRLFVLPSLLSALVAAAPAHADQVIWHAEGLLKAPAVYMYQEDESSGLATISDSPVRREAASHFADGQHYSLDIVLNDSATGYPEVGYSANTTTSFPFALESVKLRIAESGLSYSLVMPSDLRNLHVSAITSPSFTWDGKPAGHVFKGVSITDERAGLYQLTLASDDASAHLPDISFDGLLPVPFARPTLSTPSPSLREVSSILSQASPGDYGQVSTRIVGTSYACNPISGACFDATLSLNAFSVRAVPEAASAMQMAMGLAGVAAASLATTRTRRAGKAAHRATSSHQG